jgi:nickel/cobalt exporter
MMIRKIACIGLILLVLTSGVLAQNPFFSEKKQAPQPEPSRLAPPHPIFIKLAVWQKQLNDIMAGLIEQARSERRPGRLFYLFLLAFSYGVLHAAGPGHGKAVATSFMLSQKRSLGGGLVLGNGVALAHGMSGIILVLIVHFIIKSGIIGPLQTVTRTTQYISYSLVTLLGAALVIKCFIRWRAERQSNRQPGKNTGKCSGRRMLPVAIAVGMIPCPGVVMVMLFTMSMNLIGLGIILGFFMAAGMAATITLVVILAMYGKGLTLRTAAGHNRWAKRIEFVIEVFAGVMVAALGGLLLTAAICS